MGACLSLDVEEKKAKVHSEHLDKYLQDCAKQDSNIIKILLLGWCKYDWVPDCVGRMYSFSWLQG